MSQIKENWENRTFPPIGRILLRAAKTYNVAIEDIRLVSVRDGHGRHEHDESCATIPFGCLRSCDDSDWIIEVEYNEIGHRAVYGVINDEIGIWLD